MLTKEQLNQLKKELIHQHKQLTESIQNEQEVVENANARDQELSMYDNHPADLGSELFERSREFTLSIHHQSELIKTEKALEAMDNGTYGKCATCGKDIPFERLQVIPNTSFCVDHTPERALHNNRPVEEELLNPPNSNSFNHRQKNQEIADDRDSFQEVAKFGTSETPSDFRGDFDNYNTLYDQDIKDGFTEEYEMFSATNLKGKEEVYFLEAHQYMETLDEENMESPIGNIPYKRNGNYVEENEKD